MSTPSQRIPVLIVGGGPVGLALAAELGWRGIGCALIEQTDGAIGTPKMNEVNTRTMEFCRRWGIADEVLNCPFPADFPLDAAFVTSLFGHEIGRVVRPARAAQIPEPHSPYRLQACSQIWFDPMLQRLARSFPTVALHYRCRLDAFEASEHAVEARVTDLETGAQSRVIADYLVGCDGANSQVRRALGIELVGKGAIGNPINMFFRAPGLFERSGRAPATFFLTFDREGLWGSLRIIHPGEGIWRLMVDSTDGSLTPETVDRQHYLRRALGRDEPVEWLGVDIWRRRSLVAERYSAGRVFLAGDAVHQLSPTGALGMNTGMGDAVDLGWKLAATLEGWGGPRLLDSYDLERRPVGARAVRMATAIFQTNEGFGRGYETLEEAGAEGERARRELGEKVVRDVGREFRTLGLQIGYRYDGSPVIVPDGSPAPEDDPATYTPTARPGARAPHVWLGDGRSTLDLYGRGFTLVRFPGAPDSIALTRAAAQRGVPLETVALDAAEAAAIYERRLVLVRPDGHVGWRGDAVPADPALWIDTLRGAH